MATAAPPFSPWLCVAAPHLCEEPKGAEPAALAVAPYGVLRLVVDRAHGLPAADLNGLSDPYVTAQINDIDVAVRTSTQNKTLAPRWSESFELKVYRPESILTLFVHDEDFGHEDTVGFAGSLVGLSDDLLGIVDISLEKLPLNTKISGWFELQRVSHATNSYLTRVANAASAVPAGQIRLQLTLCVAEAHHELYALCLGPPAFREPMKPLDFGELLGHVSSVAHDLELVGQAAGPVIFWASRLSSVVFGTAILLVWRPQFILPLLLLTLCIFLHSDALNRRAETPDPVEPGTAPAAPTARPRDPGVNKVFKAAEAGLASHQYTEICTFQNNLGSLVESIRQLRSVWHLAVAHSFPVTMAVGCIDLFLLYFSQWQGLLLRIALTCTLAFMLVKNSCVARVARALYIYRSKDTLTSGCFGLGVTLEAIDLRSISKSSSEPGLARLGTCHLTSDAANSLSNSSKQVTSNGTPSGKPSMHVLEESSWTEPTWCKHCGGFLWGVYRQGWTCRACGVVLCHACAAENHLDFCPKSKSD